MLSMLSADFPHLFHYRGFHESLLLVICPLQLIDHMVYPHPLYTLLCVFYQFVCMSQEEDTCVVRLVF